MRHLSYTSLIVLLISAVIGATDAAAESACSSDAISQRLLQRDVYYQFVQTKTVAALSRPLASSGVIWLTSKGELVWQLSSPIKSTTVISAEGVKEFNRRDERQSAMNNPIASDLASIFLNVLSGNFAAFAQTFSQTVACQDEQWTLTLRPVAEPFLDILSMLSISGETELQHVMYEEARGDITDITLTLSSRPDDSLEVYLED